MHVHDRVRAACLATCRVWLLMAALFSPFAVAQAACCFLPLAAARYPVVFE